MTCSVYTGDCLDVLENLPRESVDLVYVDPPFFTQTVHKLQTRDGERQFSFADVWDSNSSYADFIFKRLAKVRDVMKPSASIFFHCDKSASHMIRFLLDSTFGAENFQSEIIWHFRRWSNAKRGLLNSHQTIYFYSKGEKFKFNQIWQDYSPSTNIDQIMQKRSRDSRNKSVYARGEKGEVISAGAKKGVPLSDVWEVPFLNPKAKERVGYPTQKPVLLMEKIIQLVTDPGDTVLDPFCGSGTTLVAADMLGRKAIGIDIAPEATELTKDRLRNPVVTRSALLEKGRKSYATHDTEAAKHLASFEYTPVHRNKGIDGLLKNEVEGLSVFVRVQRSGETIAEAARALRKAAKNKGACHLLLIQTSADQLTDSELEDLSVVKSAALAWSDSKDAMTCHGIFPPDGIRVRPKEGTDNEANEIFGRADHRHSGRA